MSLITDRWNWRWETRNRTWRAPKCDLPRFARLVKKKAGRLDRPASSDFPVRVRLGGEASQRATHVAFAQPLEGTVAQLADALARDAQHRSDLFQRMLASTFETEVETQHFRVARRQCAQR